MRPLILNTDKGYRRSRITFAVLASLLVSVVPFHPSLFSQPVTSTPPDNWEVRNYSTRDGLSSNTVNCMLKDGKGFMWFGTNSGLDRFDGYSFTTPKSADGKSIPLFENRILSLLEDRKGILWIGTVNGLYWYDPAMPLSQIRHFQYLKKDSPDYDIDYQPVSELFEDRNGLLWMICMDYSDWMCYGVRTFDRSTEEFTYVRIDSIYSEDGNKKSDAYITMIKEDRRGNIWFGTPSGICVYDLKDSIFQTYTPFPDSGVMNINHAGFHCEDSHGNMWVGTRYGVLTFDRDHFKFSDLVKPDTMDSDLKALTYNIKEDQNGSLWVRVNYKIFKFGPAPGGKLDFSTAEQWEYRYSDWEQYSLFTLEIDDAGAVWFSVPGFGLYRINEKRKKFFTIQPEFKKSTGSYGRIIINAVYAAPDGQVWVAASDGGLNRFDPGSSQQISYLLEFTEAINGIDQDENGSLWLTSRFGVATRAVFDHQDEVRFVPYYPSSEDPFALTGREEYDNLDILTYSSQLSQNVIYKDNQGILWFNSGKGIFDRYNPEIDGFTHLDLRQIDVYWDSTSTFTEPDGAIWFPSDHGLLLASPPFKYHNPSTIKPGRVTCFQHHDEFPGSIGSDRVRTVHISQNFNPGTIWAGTIGGGLNCMIKSSVSGDSLFQVSFKQYTTEDGLCDNNVLGILEDDHGILWLSTSKGLSRFNPEGETFINYFELDGLPTNMFTWTGPSRGKDGTMYFATELGLLKFHPDQILSNPCVPPVVITDFRIFNRSVHPGNDSPLTRHISHTESISLSYNQNFVSFEFAALNYEIPEKNQYRYMMEGLDRDWINAGDRRYVEYPGLKHGDYNFRVIASNNDGLWNEQGVSLEIHIHPPPWLSWWAYCIYVLLLLAIIFWYRSFLLKRARLRSELEIERLEKEKVRELDQMRARFFTNISHEFRTPLTLILGPVENIIRKKPKKIELSWDVVGIIHRNARRLQGLINQLLDISKLESGEMKNRVSRGDLLAHVRTIANSFLSLAETREIQYALHLPDKAPEVYFDTDKVEKIISNLVSNAFKFTPEKGAVDVSLQFEPTPSDEYSGKAIIKVKDSGIGIPADKLERIFERFYQASDSDTREEEGTGIGLALTRELVELMHGTITVESEPGRGTSFVVTLPVSKEAFQENEIITSEDEELSVAESLITEPVLDTEAETIETEAENIYKETIYGGFEETDKKPLILVVEDNPDLRKYVGELLLDQYKIIEAVNGKEGLEKTMESLPDLVISDLMMPVMGGMEMCRKLKTDPRTSHIPVVMLTAKADRESKLGGLETGADDYIIKPFDAQEMTIRVKNLIRQRKELREQFISQYLLSGEDRELSSPRFRMIRKVVTIMNQHLSDPEYTMKQLGEAMNMSRSSFFQQVTSVTGTTPNELLRMARMKRAAQLIRSGDLNITQIMNEVGFRNPSHFAQSFRKYYGINPSEYLKIKSSL